ncbi:MAG: molybdopterin guanine dinucleotide-containing S/N-oxide reductase [Pseudomonadota bacterium]
MADNLDLPLTANHWGAYRVETLDGKVVALHPFEEDADPSPIGHGIVDVLDGPTRITAPMVRKSWLENGAGCDTHKRGAEPFVQVTWDVAEKLVADELNRVRSTYGNESIYAGSYGWASAGRFHHAQSQLKRFLNCIGGFTRSVTTYSYAAAEVAVPHVLGNFFAYLASATSWPSIAKHCELMVAFGGVPLKNGQINAGGIGRHTQLENLHRAHQAGLKIVNISPLRSDVVSDVDAEWIAVRPNTDTALMLALAHTLYSENLHDQTFLDQYTVGFDEFLRYINGEKDGVVKDADWAAQICAIPADLIHQLARRMAGTRTMISASWSLTRQDHGEQPFWAAITLAAMLGQIGLPGGGIGFGYSATNSIGDHGTKIPGASLPQGERGTECFIPVARISDMLLHPGKEFDYNGKTRRYPDVRLVYWAGGNPFHHHQDLNRMLRAWHKPETIIVNEWSWNSLAKHADIVLPCTTTIERNDISFSPRDPYVLAMEKIVEPPGDARDDYAIFSGIARAMGVEDKFTEGRDEAQWLDWIYAKTRENADAQNLDIPSSYADLKRQQWFVLPPPKNPVVMLEAFRENPNANPLRTPSGKIELFSQTVADFDYEDCPGHACWLEPLEWLGNASAEYPLHLISNQPSTKLHSQLDHGSHSRAAKINGREPVMLCTAEAKQRDLKSHDIVTVHNARGRCLAAVVIDDDVMPGVAQMGTGAWFDPVEPGISQSMCAHGNPNVLTPDKGTSRLAQGPIAHTCMVQITKFEGELPPVKAFTPPIIIKQD